MPRLLWPAVVTLATSQLHCRVPAWIRLCCSAWLAGCRLWPSRCGTPRCRLHMQTGSYLLNGDPGISILLPETDNLQQQQQDEEQQQQQEAEQDVETLVIANPPAGSSISIDDQLVAAPGPDSPGDAVEGSAAAAIAATEALAASMAYMGCIVAEESVMAGDTVSLMNDVPTAEQCCQACRANPQCNVWSWCGSSQGCSYQDFSADVSLSAQQCEQPQQFPSSFFILASMGTARCMLARGSAVEARPACAKQPPLCAQQAARAPAAAAASLVQLMSCCPSVLSSPFLPSSALLTLLPRPLQLSLALCRPAAESATRGSCHWGPALPPGFGARQRRLHGRFTAHGRELRAAWLHPIRGSRLVWAAWLRLPF